jgi:hypothetical protein
MVGGSEEGYDVEVSGGQVYYNERMRGSERCDRWRREMEWGIDDSRRMDQ